MSALVEPVPRAADRMLFGHPRGLAYLAFTEAWERFSFAGMQALLVLYMVDALLKPGRIERVWGFRGFAAVLTAIFGPMAAQPMSSAIFGLYTGFAFLTPVFGGFIGDRLLGQRRTVMAGAVLMAAGHFMMAFEASFLVALLALVLGTGCLKGNISSQVGALYALDDPRRAGAFQLFSMGINLGVVVAPVVCGGLGEVFGWSWGFGAAGVGMLIGLAIYVAGRRHLPPDRRVKTVARAGPRRTGTIGGLVVVFALVTAFLITAGQFGNVYALWVRDHVNRAAFGGVIPVTWFLSLTPLASVAFAPLLVRYWASGAERGREPAMLTKMALGLGFAASAPLLLAVLAWTSGGGEVFWPWLAPVHMLVALGYLCTWPIGLALFSRASTTPGTAIGIFFISSFVASLAVGWIGGFYARVPAASFWLAQAGFGAAGVVVILLIGRPLGRLLREP